jgi:hypothetical protein
MASNMFALNPLSLSKGEQQGFGDSSRRDFQALIIVVAKDILIDHPSA